MNTKNILITFVASVCLLIIIFVTYQKYSTITIEYTGLGESLPVQQEVKTDIIISENVLNSDKIEFVQRKITGGGVNPGWVISLLETQPNIFTGRVIVDDGVYQHPITVKEEIVNVFIGEMKSVNKKNELFSMKKQDKECIDEEGNIFEYSLSGTYGATQFSGCGGEVKKVAE